MLTILFGLVLVWFGLGLTVFSFPALIAVGIAVGAFVVGRVSARR